MILSLSQLLLRNQWLLWKRKSTLSLYTFIVHTDATKNQIKEAVEKLFEGTKVEKVNTMNLEGKTRRRGRTSGKTAKTKKAIVKLTQDSKEIEIFEGL